MSADVFPALAGLDVAIERAPLWEDDEDYTASGRRSSVTNWSYPIYEFTIDLNVLFQEGGALEVNKLIGFFNKHRGRWDYWRFFDQDFHVVTNEIFGVGNGVRTSFALTRSMDGNAEPIGDIKVLTALTVNDVAQVDPTHFGVLDNRIIVFNSPPAIGHVLRWTGEYYFRCHFARNRLPIKQLGATWHEARSVQFRTWKM